MAITDPILLSPDVVLVPVAELPEEVRRRLDPGEGDWAITHPRARTPSRLLDAASAALLAELKSPRTIVDAVIRYSQARDLDPESTLVEAYPLLERLLAAGFLVAAGSEEAGGIVASLAPGDRVVGFEVLEAVQVLEDTELHLARGEGGAAALKIERPAARGKSREAFKREAAVLERLSGEIAPRLLATGELEGRCWLAVEWLPGVDAASAASELRRRGDRAGLLALCRAVLAAYAHLHERGVIHADVHPRNVLVGPAGEIRLIDFGLSLAEDLPGDPGRGGVAFYFEPEYAAAVRAGELPPAASAPGEQYALAALVYQLLAGAPTHDFKLARDEMLRQVAEEPPLPFALREAEPWPAAEAVLARALAKAPGERFPSVADFAAALGAVEPSRQRPAGNRAAEALLERVLERVGVEGPLFRDGLPEPPRASVTYGAAGIACALHRVAMAREDAALLSLADLWAAKAAATIGTMGEEAFYRPDSRLTPEHLGRVSPFHTASGVHAVRAMIAHALGDPGSRREATTAFLAASAAPCPNPDLTLGRSGLLLAASLLLEAPGEPPAELRAFGDGLLAGLWEEIAELPPVPDCVERPNLGMAHGWAGYLYASLRWCRAAGAPIPEGVPTRLAELADRAHPSGRGLRWRWYAESGSDVGTMAGWCNGSAGFVFLWTLAHQILGEPRYREMAEGAAWSSWEAPDPHGTLCCGLAGRAYALLNLWKHGGGAPWLTRARDLANQAALSIERTAEAPDSLYKGTVGVAALAADLARPEAAVLPFFEEEGWG
ncbi:MAG: lanthionine synthetase LanC family protein [Thermoanaerobaculia bacterium]